MHEDTWQLKAKCQGMAMHEKWLEWRVGTRDTWHGNTRCQVNWIRNSPPRPNQFGGIEEKKRGKGGKERKERKEEKKRDEELVLVSFWLPNWKVLRTRSEVFLRSKR